LKGIRLITSDACIGHAESAAEFFPEAASGEDLAAAREKAIRVIEKLRGLRLGRAAELVEAAVEETLSY
jgi:hypothetical protein